MAGKIYTAQPYQRLGSQFIIDHQRCHIWAKPGMGKTTIALSAIDILMLAGSNFFPAVVVAPKRVALSVWSGEIEKWSSFQGIKLVKILGNREQRLAALRRPGDLYVINFENVPWLISVFEQAVKKWPFKFVIIDEARKLKGLRWRKGTIRARGLSEIARHTGRWVNLGGSPAAKDFTDLWGQNWFIDFGSRLGTSYTRFKKMFFQENPYTRQLKLLPGAEEEIHKLMNDVAIAFRPEDWFVYEKPRWTPVDIELPTAARKAYDEMENKMFANIGPEGVEAFSEGMKSGKLMQIAAGSLYDGDKEYPLHDMKIEALDDIFTELNETLLVGYFFKFTERRILEHFPQARVIATKKDEDDWNAGKIEMGLLHYQSAAHGLNLQDGGRAVCRVDQIWDEELRQQIVERLGPARQIQSGYKRTVLIYDILARNTLEYDALGRSAERVDMQEALMIAESRRK